MCALKRELAVDFAELRHVEIECQCGTGILVDLTSTTALNPSLCPGCHQNLKIKNLLDDFKILYRELAKHEQASVRFRVPFSSSVD